MRLLLLIIIFLVGQATPIPPRQTCKYGLLQGCKQKSTRKSGHWPKNNVARKIRTQLESLGGSYTRPTVGYPWPWPQRFNDGGVNLTIYNDTLKFSTDYQCDILTEAMKRYRTVIFAGKANLEKSLNVDLKRARDLTSFTTLDIRVKNPCEKYPQEDMMEQYTLSIWPNGTGLLEASAVWGALRGLETFSQLVFSTDENQWLLRTAEIEDFPRFSFRGILLDTSRHFIPLPSLMRNLDLMEHNKFNVFHWHIVDDPSFPYVSSLFPDLSLKGAYSQKHIYTPDDVKKVIEYARLRGIRVLPEFDTPGHTLSWGAGQPDLLTPCYDKDGKLDGTYGPIDPTNDRNFDFLTALFSEILDLFPERYVHLGGDEVPFDCWASNPKIRMFMELQGFPNDFAMLENYYMQNLLFVLQRARNGTGTFVWQEVFDNKVQLRPDTIIHVWRGNKPEEWQSELKSVTSKELRAVLSSCWYLNYIDYGADWMAYYKCDPRTFPGTNGQKDLVIGGEACMWGEYVDATNLIPRLWPRASVVAERLWSSENLTDTGLAAPRLEEHRCRLLRRGYPVEVINGPGYCAIEWIS